VEVAVSSLRRLALGTLLGAFPGPVAPDWARDLVAEGLAGHVLFGTNVVDRRQLGALTARLRDARPDVLIGIDEEGGDVTRLAHRDGSPYPGNGALGAVDDPPVTRAVYRAIGGELAAVGIDLDLAPAVDVNSTPENPVIGPRSFGADPELVSRHAVAAVLGLQEAGVAACAKHFPGHGATTADSHLELPTVDVTPEVLAARDLPPFAAVARAGIKTVMTAHIRVPSVTGDAPATFSPAAIRLLRDDIGFDGVVVTDALEMQGAVRASGGSPQGAVLALAAGVDLLCVGARVTAELIESIVAEITAAVSDGRLSEARLSEAAGRVEELTRWTRAQATVPSEPAVELGLATARRAVRVDGQVPDLGAALIVQLESHATIAEGRTPWGLFPHLPAGHPAMRVVAADTCAADVLSRAGAAPVVITGRNLHRLAGAAPLVEAVAGTHDVVAVEMGWPGSWRPAGVRAFVTTYGAARANARAAAEALRLPARD
jgi:beta-N-acetylhexosaminidase